MKRFLMLFLAFYALSALLFAQQARDAEVQRFVRKHLPKAVAKRLKATNNNGTTFKVYEDAAQKGFVLVAESAQGSTVLGHSDTHAFHEAQMPPALRALLQQYEVPATAEVLHTRAPHPHYSNPTAIGPLLTTTWDQSDPYNKYTPKGNQKAPTGCVATALAQILNYYQWPVNRHASILKSYNEEELNAEKKGTTYQWSQIPRNARTPQTDAAKDAVAVLMRDIGKAVSMKYGTSSGASSGANSRNAYHAVVDTFDYHARYYARNGFASATMLEMMRNELENKRPFYISGSGGDAAHAFVCDGINDNDELHINWGWNGMSDGFFSLNLLLPGSYGTGGGNAHLGFNNAQVIIFLSPNNKPDPFEGTKPLMMALGGTFYALKDTYNTSEKVSLKLTHTANAEQGGRFFSVKLVVFDEDNRHKAEVQSTYARQLDFDSYTNWDFQDLSLQGLADGDYTIRPFSCINPKDNMPYTEWSPVGNAQALHFSIANGIATFYNPKHTASLKLVGGIDELVRAYGTAKAALGVRLENGTNNVQRGKLKLYFVASNGQKHAVTLSKTITVAQNDKSVCDYVLPYTADNLTTGKYSVSLAFVPIVNGKDQAEENVEMGASACEIEVRAANNRANNLTAVKVECQDADANKAGEIFNLDEDHQLTLKVDYRHVGSYTYRGNVRLFLKDIVSGEVVNLKTDNSKRLSYGESANFNLTFLPSDKGIKAGHTYSVHLEGTFNGDTYEFWNTEKPRFYLSFTGKGDTLPLRIGIDQVSTFFNTQAYEMPSGLTGYAVTFNESTQQIVLRAVATSGTKVAAQTPLLIKGEMGNYEAKTLQENLAPLSAPNLLKGTATDATIQAQGKQKLYRLSTEANTGIGFYWESQTQGQTLHNKAGKCYLPLDANIAQEVRAFLLTGDKVTGIKDAKAPTKNQSIYDLYGRRLTRAPQHGVLIVDGKKTIR